MIRIGSLCSGYGGLEMGILLAAYRLGMEARVVWQIDNNAYACKILRARRIAPVVLETDIEGVDYEALEPCDILCAGLPCQPWTNAGAQRGADDERNLFPAFFEICDRLQPRAILLENADELPNVDDGRTFRRIVGEAAERWQHIEWGVLSAASVGANHVRERLFLYAHTHRVGQQQSATAIGGGYRQNTKRDAALSKRQRRTVVHAPDTSHQILAHADRQHVERRDGQKAIGRSRASAIDDAAQRAIRRPRASEPRLCRADDGVAVRLDNHLFPRGLYDTSQDAAVRVTTKETAYWSLRMKALGNGVVPQQAAVPAMELLRQMTLNKEVQA